MTSTASLLICLALTATCVLSQDYKEDPPESQLGSYKSEVSEYKEEVKPSYDPGYKEEKKQEYKEKTTSYKKEEKTARSGLATVDDPYKQSANDPSGIIIKDTKNEQSLRKGFINDQGECWCKCPKPKKKKKPTTPKVEYSDPIVRSGIPNIEYKTSAPEYKAPAQEYKAPAPEYKAPAPEYKAPAPEYKAPVPEYKAPAQEYKADPIAPAPSY